MNEVTKLYKNAGIEKSCNSDLEFCPVEFCDECNLNIYPEFTAEKQLNLIEFLSYKTLEIGRNIENDYFYIQVDNRQGVGVYNTLEEALASRISAIWQDLTEEERKQIKEILE